MTETTTIQITTEQADQLTSRKQYDDEAYKSVIGRLLAQPTGDDLAEEIAQLVADELQG